MTDFFPPATLPEAPTSLTVPIAKIVRVMTCEDSRIAFAAAVEDEEGKHTIYRFVLPHHNRLCRRFFREAGVEPTRTRETYDITAGAFMIGFEGTRVGSDPVPEEGPLKEIAILENVVIKKMA